VTRRRHAREREVFRVLALGVQVYRVEPDRDGRLVARPIGPRAILFDYAGHKLGTVSMGERGPVWALGAGRVVGKAPRTHPPADADCVRNGKIEATASGGDGALAGATLVEQVGTFGGAAPPVVPSIHAGDTMESPFSAEYVFYAESS